MNLIRIFNGIFRRISGLALMSVSLASPAMAAPKDPCAAFEKVWRKICYRQSVAKCRLKKNNMASALTTYRLAEKQLACREQQNKLLYALMNSSPKDKSLLLLLKARALEPIGKRPLLFELFEDIELLEHAEKLGILKFYIPEPLIALTKIKREAQATTFQISEATNHPRKYPKFDIKKVQFDKGKELRLKLHEWVKVYWPH